MNEFLNRYLPLDKAYHLIVGFITFAFLQTIDEELALISVVLLAIGKEIYDKLTDKGTSEWKDAAYTIVGGILGYICSL